MALLKLDQRYGGERRQLQRHMEAIIGLPVIKEDNLTELEDISNRLCDIIAKLNDYGRTQELVGTSSLYTLVLQKMPSNLLLRYHETCQGIEDTEDSDGLAKFADWLNRQVSLRLELAEIQGSSRKPQRKSNENQPGRQKSNAHSS
jgi:hypothetical protein